MTAHESREYEVKGIPLVCPICGRNRFWIRKTLMNTTGATLFGLDWANRSAVNYVCDYCGHILWFWQEE